MDTRENNAPIPKGLTLTVERIPERIGRDFGPPRRPGDGPDALDPGYNAAGPGKDRPRFRYPAHYLCTLTYQGRRMRCEYSKGSGHAEKSKALPGGLRRIPPTLAEVLDCLALDAQGVDNARCFEEWADEYGFDPDSRKAEDSYRATVKQTRDLRALLGRDYAATVYPPQNEEVTQ